MPKEWRTKTIKSIRWLLVEVGGKLIKHGRTLTLKIAASLEKYRLYLEMILSRRVCLAGNRSGTVAKVRG